MTASNPLCRMMINKKHYIWIELVVSIQGLYQFFYGIRNIEPVRHSSYGSITSINSTTVEPDDK